MTPLQQHIEEMQVKAMNLQYILGAIRALESGVDDKFRDERTDLEEIACGAARELSIGLDIVNLPQENGSAS